LRTRLRLGGRERALSLRGAFARSQRALTHTCRQKQTGLRAQAHTRETQTIGLQSAPSGRGMRLDFERARTLMCAEFRWPWKPHNQDPTPPDCRVP
jgi:hypothetical protein